MRLKRPPVETPFGFKISAPRAMQDGSFERSDVRIIRQIMDASDLFINIGANVGYYCCFAQMAGLRTIAVEPQPNNATLLMRNMRANRWGDNITILPVAVGDTPGIVDMYGEGTGASLVRGWARNPVHLARQVPVVRLDDVVPPLDPAQQTFILMDVEGFELHALRGASTLINAPTKPIWMIEISLSRHQPDGSTLSETAGATFEIMKTAGYEAYEVGETLIPHEWDVIEAACRGEPTPIQWHNFVFVAAGTDITTLLADD